MINNYWQDKTALTIIDMINYRHDNSSTKNYWQDRTARPHYKIQTISCKIQTITNHSS